MKSQSTIQPLTPHKDNHSYAFEFHIPYYTIRQGKPKVDTRKLYGKPMRESKVLPLKLHNGRQDLYYCPTQLSFLIHGIDEWRYTSYCCVDTYFGSEADHREYLNAPAPMEPATGGLKELNHPIWNPREFFLCVLSFRIEQAVTQSQALIDSFEQRMNAYVGT